MVIKQTWSMSDQGRTENNIYDFSNKFEWWFKYFFVLSTVKGIWVYQRCPPWPDTVWYGARSSDTNVQEEESPIFQILQGLCYTISSKRLNCYTENVFIYLFKFGLQNTCSWISQFFSFH